MKKILASIVLVMISQSIILSQNVLEIRNQSKHEDLAIFFVLILDKTEEKWNIMKQASQIITSQTLEEEKEIKKVVIMYYDDEKYMPPNKPNSKRHAINIIYRSLAAPVLEDKLIGYTEAEKASSEVIKYPVKALYNKAESEVWKELNQK